MVEVTQADREAAAELIGANLSTLTADFVRSGGADGFGVVEVFARHRVAVLEEAAQVCERNEKWHSETFRKEVILKNADKQTHYAARAREASETAAAIRALKGEG